MYHRNVPSFSNEHVGHRRDGAVPPATEQLSRVAHYIPRYIWYFEARCYQEMRQQGGTMTFRDESDGERENILSA